MKDSVHQLINRTLLISGKFGFVSREVFWNHISMRKRTENYANWAKLTASKFFKPYPGLDNYLFVSQTGIHALREMSAAYVGRAHPIYFEHDSRIMSVALACENAGLIQSDWVGDAVIRKSPNTAKVSLLGAAADKIPDLVFNLKAEGPTTRVALEIERSRKSSARYDALVLSYMEMRLVNMVIIAYSDPYIERQIRVSMKRLGYPQSSRPAAFCKVSDLIERPCFFPIQIGDHTIGFDQFVANLRQIQNQTGSGSSFSPDKIEELKPAFHPMKREA